MARLKNGRINGGIINNVIAITHLIFIKNKI